MINCKIVFLWHGKSGLTTYAIQEDVGLAIIPAIGSTLWIDTDEEGEQSGKVIDVQHTLSRGDESERGAWRQECTIIINQL